MAVNFEGFRQQANLALPSQSITNSRAKKGGFVTLRHNENSKLHC